MGSYFGISGAPWEAILAPRDYPGGPWEQQDGHEVARQRILIDFGLISGHVSVSSWVRNAKKNLFIFRLVSKSCLSISDSILRRRGLRNRCFRIEFIAKSDFPRNRF